jgi:hypothetical protein
LRADGVLEMVTGHTVGYGETHQDYQHADDQDQNSDLGLKAFEYP